MSLRPLSRFAHLRFSWLPWLSALASAAGAPTAEQIEFFEKKIRPVLVAECYECHGADKQKGGLALDSREGWVKGGDDGPAIVPGQPEESLLIRSITHADPDLKMPNKAPKLAPAVIADFITWVKMGAPDPRAEPDAKTSVNPKSCAETLTARRQWWCFQPIQNPPPPTPRNASWSEHPIDRFLLAKMEERGLFPAPDADASTLLRRLTFALTGVPPTAEEVEAFAHQSHASYRSYGRNETDGTDNSHVRLIARLLASPAFGERWARHWMDLVRYAETYGSEHDYLSPHAWRYRDYLVRAFNADLPYDVFIHEQLAGDLLEPRWSGGINEALLATAYHRMVESYATPVDVKREEVSTIEWQIESLGKTFLGITLNCARCHDHKFDPISDEDFYALYGVFASTRPMLNILDEPARLTAHDGELARLKDEIRADLAGQWRAVKPSPQPKRADEQNAGHVVFADFTRGDLAGWRVAGPGLPEKPSPPGLLSLGADGAVRAIQPAGFFSDAISERHGGSIRSPEFVIEKKRSASWRAARARRVCGSSSKTSRTICCSSRP